MSSIKYCEYCGKEHNGSYGSGRFCSLACAHARSHTADVKKKTSESLKKTYARIEKEGRTCEKCKSIFHSKDMSRKLCFNCLPTLGKDWKDYYYG